MTAASGKGDERGMRRVYLVDGSGLIFRAYFALLRRPLTTSRGHHVGALFGFISTLLALLRNEGARHLAVAFDSEGPTFRHERYPSYKANRPETPPELVEQFPLVRRGVEAMGICSLQVEGVEADDLIGSLATQGARAGWEIVIVSADKDFSQLIGSQIAQYVPARGREPARWIRPEDVVEKWGVSPEQFVDFLALSGDSSDNIPGVRGIGPKTAAVLLQAHDDLDAIYAHLAEVTPVGTRTKLEAGRDDALLSRELVRLRTDLLEFDPDRLRVPKVAERGELRIFLEEHELHSLVTRIFAPRAPRATPRQGSLLDAPSAGAAPDAEASVTPGGRAGIADGWDAHYVTLTDLEALDRALSSFPRERGDETFFALDTETGDLDWRTTPLVGISFGWEPGRAWYVPIGHDAGGNLPLDGVVRRLDALLADPTLVKAGHNLKFDLHVLRRHGFEVTGPLRDTLVASYLRDPDAHHKLDAVSAELLGHCKVPIESLIGEGKNRRSMAAVEIAQAGPYACEDADAVVRLKPRLERLLRDVGALQLYRDVEMPLLPVLAAMESAGIELDVALLEAMGTTLAAEMERRSHEIRKLAGEEFNVNSPKQLQVILFEKLKLKPTRRTKTGYSTGREVLEELSTLHPLPRRILDYRQVTKLRSTYVEALPRMVDAGTGRVHASFHQTVTATGRLSSSDPNLQNIPIRTALGREIRKAFVAPRGFRLLSADYSQIELRLLAHLSGDEYLRQAFRQGADIHRATASRVFGVEEAAVDPAMRARAKVVNFGVLYGMGAQRLAREQGIAVKEASRFIAEYFEKLPGVKAYVDRCVAEARSRGYARTILGRRRYLPDLRSSRHQARAAAERMAVNTPVQGSAADLIKVAMVRLHARLGASRSRTRLLLQVHDELVFEVPAGEVDALTRDVQREMSSVLELEVPLVVATGAGRTWYDAHA